MSILLARQKNDFLGEENTGEFYWCITKKVQFDKRDI